MADNLFRETIQGAINSLRELADCETVIGKPIEMGEMTLIPVSKVSVGFVGGGLDYHSRHAKNTTPSAATQNASCGGGTGVTVSPVGFLVTRVSGAVEFLPVSAQAPANLIDSAAMLLEKTPEIARQFKDVFARREEKKD